MESPALATDAVVPLPSPCCGCAYTLRICDDVLTKNRTMEVAINNTFIVLVKL